MSGAPRTSPPQTENWRSFLLFAAVMTVGIGLMFAIVITM